MVYKKHQKSNRKVIRTISTQFEYRYFNKVFKTLFSNIFFYNTFHVNTRRLSTATEHFYPGTQHDRTLTF